MFGPLCNKLAFVTSAPILAAHLRRPFASAITAESSLISSDLVQSLTISYLTDTCGLSPESALSASKKIQIQAAEKPNSILQTFKDHGFSQTQVASTISKIPRILFSKPQKSIKAKLDFLRDSGFTEPEIADIISANPILLRTNLERKIVPFVDYFKTALPSRALLIDLLKSSNCFNPLMAQNIDVLRSHGIHEDLILKLLKLQPRALTRASDEFAEVVGNITHMGFDPSSSLFIRAIAVMSYTSKKSLERKIAVYRSFGWSEGDVISAFIKQPTCLGLADEQIKRKMEFFINKLGWDPTFLAEKPSVLLFSLDNRIVPRCSVLNLLISQCLIRKKKRLVNFLTMAEKLFFEKYVRKYEKEVPEIIEAYEGKVDFKGWDFEWDEVV